MNELLPLRDIHAPPAVGWWPPAPGWWLAALLLVIGTVLLTRWVRRRGRRGYRRAALREAEQIFADWQRSTDDVAYCTAINTLLKRTALAAYPAAGVARLSGKEWLAFLDRGLRQARFAQPSVAPFADHYSTDATNVDIAAVQRAAEHWIRRHRC